MHDTCITQNRDWRHNDFSSHSWDGAQPVKGNHRITTFPRPSLRTDVTLNHSHVLSQFIFTALGGSYHPCSESEVRKFGQVSQIETSEKRVWRIRACATTPKFTVTALCSSASSGLLGTWWCILVTRPAKTPSWIILCCPDLFFNGIRNEWKLKRYVRKGFMKTFLLLLSWTLKCLLFLIHKVLTWI